MKYLYEFVGTFFLVLTVGMTVLMPNNAGMMAPLAIGLVLVAMIYAGAHISGAHYNPAVSLAIYLRGKLSLKDLGLYWIVQLIAALVAGYLTIYFKGGPAAAPFQWETGKEFLAEFLFTFALCFVVLNVGLSNGTKGNSFYGLAVGFTILVGAYCFGSISNAAFNPAVGLGVTIMNLSTWSHLWVYFVANFLAAIFAVLLFRKLE